MAWRGWGFGYPWGGRWPGRGPFSYLPPWQRPGWLFGRGACWWLFGPYWWLSAPYWRYFQYPVIPTTPPTTPPSVPFSPQMTVEQLTAYLNSLKAEKQRLDEEIAKIEQQLKELKQ